MTKKIIFKNYLLFNFTLYLTLVLTFIKFNNELIGLWYLLGISFISLIIYLIVYNKIDIDIPVALILIYVLITINTQASLLLAVLLSAVLNYMLEHVLTTKFKVKKKELLKSNILLIISVFGLYLISPFLILIPLIVILYNTRNIK